jgi:hypothetical protein
MVSKTVVGCVWFGLILFPLVSSSSAQTLAISVFNDANVAPGMLASAEASASRVFHQAGLETEWIDCPSSPSGTSRNTRCTAVAFPKHLHVRILARSRTLTSSILGTSYLDADEMGCYSEVFFEPIASLRLDSGETVGTALGHVMAHEIAHLLLGSRSHASMGIMRAQWQGKELLAASRGRLLFTPEESRTMRAKLFAATNREVKGSTSSFAGIGR